MLVLEISSLLLDRTSHIGRNNMITIRYLIVTDSTGRHSRVNVETVEHTGSVRCRLNQCWSGLQAYLSLATHLIAQ